ncbi:MAG: hypothetical protein AAGH81_19660, partial [Bacteroidota bacterium]
AIKYRNDELPKIYKRRVSGILDEWHGYGNYPPSENIQEEIEERVKGSMKNSFKSNELLMRIKDIYFPLLLGTYAMVVCFGGEWAVF